MTVSARRTLAALAVLASTVLAGCSGVPSSSAPEVIKTVGGGVAPAPTATVTPEPGADQHTIVASFLTAASHSDDAHHTAARAFLTQDARSKWTDATVTVLSSLQVGVPDAHNSVQVSGIEVGSVDQRGIYTPLLQGDGTTGTPVSFTFEMQRVQGQWRIAQLANGIIIDKAGFVDTFKPRPIYYFDLASQKWLVPDLRYTALTDQSLCTWLLEQLIDPPRPELQESVTTELPAQTQHATVSCTSGIVVDLPGANQLDDATKRRLAAQLAYTFDLDNVGQLVELVDGTHPVAIPQVSSPFAASDFNNFAPSAAPPNLYYLHDGALVTDTGSPVSPGTGTSAALESVALATRDGGVTLVAGVGGKADAARLLVGTTAAALKPASGLSGSLIRPAWMPFLDEVWDAADQTLFRVPATLGLAGRPGTVALAGRTGAVTGAIRAIAFSPDGVRVALVIDQDQITQVWVGSVVRTDQAVRVDSLEPVTPPGISATDVAWNDSTTLYFIGVAVASPNEAGFWSVQSDGSLLTPRSVAGLPAVPDSLAAAPNALPWVSAGGSVWVQQGGGYWAPPGATGDVTPGTSPTYVH